MEDTIYEAAPVEAEREPRKDSPNLQDTIYEPAPVEAEREPPKDSPKQSIREPHKDAPKEVAAKVPAVESGKASMGQAALGAVGAKIQRATSLARDVEGDVAHRVRKVREISGVVLDEAGYDPSLRFVLVAVVIFILFLVVVLLNKVIT